jgi:hypothetical protein
MRAPTAFAVRPPPPALVHARVQGRVAAPGVSTAPEPMRRGGRSREGPAPPSLPPPRLSLSLSLSLTSQLPSRATPRRTRVTFAQEPVELAHFSKTRARGAEYDDHQLKRYMRPSVPFDLSEGFETFRDRDRGGAVRKLNPQL